MSMRDLPSRGFVVPVKSFVKYSKNSAKFLELIDDNPDDDFTMEIESEIEEILESHGIAAQIESIYRFDPENDWSDDLEDGLYVIFSESSLFTRKPTAAHKALEGMGLTPVESLWTVFG